MPKIKVICRDKNNYEKINKSDIEKVYRNSNSNLHPHIRAREYVRALNSAKMEKIFAKPFLFALDNHTDGVKCMAKNYKQLSEIVSGSYDAQIILWDIMNKQPIFNINSKHEFVKGLCFSNTGNEFISVGDDKKINIWSKNHLYEQQLISEKSKVINNNNDKFMINQTSNLIDYIPYNTYLSSGSLESVDHNYLSRQFCTAGEVVSIWDYNSNKPITTFKNSSDGFLKAKYNFVEENIILASGMDRSISIYDARIKTPTHNVVLNNKSAALCWNPQEPFTFTLGNEDSNCYTFDMRKLDQIKMIHKDHILAVLDLDYSPTGKEFVTGSFDKTVRIFDVNQGRSREVYFNRRMQK